MENSFAEVLFENYQPSGYFENILSLSDSDEDLFDLPTDQLQASLSASYSNDWSEDEELESYFSSRSQDHWLDALDESSFVTDSPQNTTKELVDRNFVISQIESIFERQFDALLDPDNGEMAVTLKPRKRHAANVIAWNGAKSRLHTYRFPGRTTKEAWRYTVIIRILELVHEALVADVFVTKREIYYRDPALFGSQSTVDRYVDDVAFTFEVPRHLLNVRATAKGLAAGAFTVWKKNGAHMDGLSDGEGQLISMLTGEEVVEMENLEWVLVIEKEATFQCLIQTLWEQISKSGAIITAKGYPDLFTRTLLHLLAVPSSQNNWKEVQVLGLVDFDPDGIEILSTYKYGSQRMTHEHARPSVPNMRLIGLHSGHICKREDFLQSQGLLKLSQRDRRRAQCMLLREPFCEGGREPSWRRELHVMLLLNHKAEIQFLAANAGGLIGWIEEEGVLPMHELLFDQSRSQ